MGFRWEGITFQIEETVSKGMALGTRVWGAEHFHQVNVKRESL